MDTNIEAEVKSRRSKKIILYVLGGIVLVVAAILLLRSSFASSVSRSSITTAIVEKGSIENTLEASGEILPEFEIVITSPIAASIQTVAADEGTAVKTGQDILTLDKSATEAEYKRLKLLLNSKKNDIEKLKVELDKTIYEIKSNDRIKELEINSFKADVENTQRLYKAGGATRADVEKAELSLKVAQEEKLKLENEIRSQQLTTQAEMKAVRIEADIQENDMRELERKLQQANIVSGREGVVTWVNKNIGVAIQEGETLARIANLNSFKVQGSISDNHLNELHNNMPAVIRLSDTLIRGKITNIQPTIQNSVVSFTIQLDEPNNHLLRPNMKVDVYLVTASEENILRVANGPAFTGSATQNIFVMEKGKAVRKKINIGLTNFDYVELKGNVKPGDVVITSDMSQYKYVNEITVTQ